MPLVERLGYNPGNTRYVERELLVLESEVGQENVEPGKPGK